MMDLLRENQASLLGSLQVHLHEMEHDDLQALENNELLVLGLELGKHLEQGMDILLE